MRARAHPHEEAVKSALGAQEAAGYTFRTAYLIPRALNSSPAPHRMRNGAISFKAMGVE